MDAMHTPPVSWPPQLFDVFISHASEDKDSIARPLAEALRARGWSVWYDEFELRLGDSLRRRIDRGLAESRFGLVILSPAFFAKEWPRRELDGLTAREVGTVETVILPIWHEIARDFVARFSPVLADRLAAHSHLGLAAVIDQVERVLALRPVAREAPVPFQAGRGVLASGSDPAVSPEASDSDRLADPPVGRDRIGAHLAQARKGPEHRSSGNRRARANRVRWLSAGGEVDRHVRRLAKKDIRRGRLDDVSLESLQQVIDARRRSEGKASVSDELLAALIDLADRLCLRSSPDNPRAVAARQEVVKALTARDERQAAVVALKELVADVGQRRYTENRQDIEARHELASLLEQAGDHASAAAQHRINARRLEQLDDGTAETTVVARRAASDAFARAGQWSEAILEDKLRVTAFAQDPTSDAHEHFRAREELANRLLHAGRWDEAIRTLEQSFRLLEMAGDDELDSAWQRVACALENLYGLDGRLDVAASLWRRMLEKVEDGGNSRVARLWPKYAAALTRAGAHSDAIAARRRILAETDVANSPDAHLRALFALCAALEAAGDRIGAVNELRAMLEVLPAGSPDTQIHILEVESYLAVLSAADDREASIERLEWIADEYERIAGPQDDAAFHARVTVAWMLGVADDWSRAVTAYRTLTRDIRQALDDEELRDRDLEVQAWRGLVEALTRTGETELAIQELRALIADCCGRTDGDESNVTRFRGILIRLLMKESSWPAAKMELGLQLDDLRAAGAGAIAELSLKTHVAQCIGEDGDWEAALAQLGEIEDAAAALADASDQAPTRAVFRWPPLSADEPVTSTARRARDLRLSARLQRAWALFESGTSAAALQLAEDVAACARHWNGTSHPTTLNMWESWIQLLERDGQWGAACEQWNALIDTMEHSQWCTDDAVLRARGYAAWALGEAGDWAAAVHELTQVEAVMTARYGRLALTTVGVSRSLAIARERTAAGESDD